MAARQADEIPVALIMERRLRRQGRWTFPSWTAIGVVVGQEAGRPSAGPQAGPRRIHRHDDGAEQFVWAGLKLPLYRDAAESYWHNLVGRHPSLFAICRPGPDGEPTPWAITADYDEAGAYMEADDTVFSVPLPAEIQRHLEEFVIAHYRPTPPRKRRRTSWTEDIDHGRRSST